jgi:hypothetical protein
MNDSEPIAKHSKQIWEWHLQQMRWISSQSSCMQRKHLPGMFRVQIGSMLPGVSHVDARDRRPRIDLSATIHGGAFQYY